MEGHKNVGEFINSDFNVRTIVATSAFINSNPKALSQYAGELIESPESFLVEAGTFQSNQDCLAVVEMKEDVDFEPAKHVFMLDGISDPGNLGTIIRTLDWFGFHQLVCSLDTTDLYNPKVINATMGSFCRVQVIYRNLSEYAGKHPRLVLGADMAGKNVNTLTFDEPAFIVMGSESHGIRSEIASLISDRITIPRLGGAESLNVAIATGIIASRIATS